MLDDSTHPHMPLTLWQLRQIVTQRELLATTTVLVGILVAFLVGHTVTGALLAAVGTYALVLPEFAEPHDPTAQ